MTPFIRLFFQSAFWIILWVAIWISNGIQSPFIRANGPIFLCQFILLIGLIHYAVPELLVKRKLIWFLLISIGAIALCSWFSMLLNAPNVGRGHMPRVNRTPPLMESRFFVQLLILSITGITAIVIEMFVLVEQKVRSEAIIKADLMESELKILKMQINPHFLFNALNNIYALSVMDSIRTQEGISRLSGMLRYVLYDCEKAEVLLTKEVVYISNFIELFKLKSSEPYQIRFVEKVEHTGLMIAPMIFIPFIENAFKHSGIERRGESFVDIELKANENSIYFFVENSLPMHISEHDPNSGIGIENVSKRLDILYPEKHNLKITKNETYSVSLKITLT